MSVGEAMIRCLDWFFRDRRTGRVTIAQWPNLLLTIFLAATILDLALHPSGALGTATRVAAVASLAGWAADEVLRGVNPWRRVLGFGVLAHQAWTLLA